MYAIWYPYTYHLIRRKIDLNPSLTNLETIAAKNLRKQKPSGKKVQMNKSTNEGIKIDRIVSQFELQQLINQPTHIITLY